MPEPTPIDVLCIGHSAYDLSVFLPEFPVEGAKYETRRLQGCGGGPAANAACLLGLWGASCWFMGWVGDDSYGQASLAEMRKAGVDITLVEVRPDAATPVSAVLVNMQTGSRTIINCKPDGPAVIPPIGAFSCIRPGLLLMDGHEPAASLAALEAFPHAISVLDAGALREGTAVLAGRVAYLVASERFARQVSGLAPRPRSEDEVALAEALRERYGNFVVVTLGERGLVCDRGEGGCYVPAIAVNAEDTTAAGDIFHGAFAYGLLHGAPWEDLLTFASLAAAISVQSLGGRASIPDLEAVLYALRHD